MGDLETQKLDLHRRWIISELLTARYKHLIAIL